MTNSANSQSIQQPLPDKVLPFAKIRECNNNSPTTRLILAQPLNGLEVCGFSVWSGENKPTIPAKLGVAQALAPYK